jgi:hypothetical protein
LQAERELLFAYNCVKAEDEGTGYLSAEPE